MTRGKMSVWDFIGYATLTVGLCVLMSLAIFHAAQRQRAFLDRIDSLEYRLDELEQRLRQKAS